MFRNLGTAGAFSSRDFRIFTAGNFVSLVGLWLQRLAVGWLVWELTHSGFWLGAVAFADLFPIMVIGPFAGVLADRRNRRNILIVCKCLQALQALALAVLVYVGAASVEVVVGLTLCKGIIIGVMQAARHSIVPSLVHSDHLGSAVAINSIIANIARFIGPAAAGVIISRAGVDAALAASVFGHIAMVIALLAIRPVKVGKTQHRSVVQDIIDGFRYVLNHAVVGRLLAVEVVLGLSVRPVIELLPGFSGAVFESGANGLALLTSSIGIGAIAGGLWLALRSGVRGLAAVTLGFLGGAGAVTVAFAAIDQLWLGALLMAALGATMVISGAGTQILIQRSVDDHMRGRVLSIWGLAHRGVPAIGALGMGWLAEFWGFGVPVAAGGLFCVGAAVLMFRHRATLERLLEESGPLSPPLDKGPRPAQ
ncbi:MAG: MFS transporter [Paracoccaceae bacterium]